MFIIVIDWGGNTVSMSVSQSRGQGFESHLSPSSVEFEWFLYACMGLCVCVCVFLSTVAPYRVAKMCFLGPKVAEIGFHLPTTRLKRSATEIWWMDVWTAQHLSYIFSSEYILTLHFKLLHNIALLFVSLAM